MQALQPPFLPPPLGQHALLSITTRNLQHGRAREERGPGEGVVLTLRLAQELWGKRGQADVERELKRQMPQPKGIQESTEAAGKRRDSQKGRARVGQGGARANKV